MYADMISGIVPASIFEFEELADRYGIGSIWMGLHTLREVMQGKMRWEEWLPDGLYPTNRGSHSYGSSVNGYLHEELKLNVAEIETSITLPTPVDPMHWEHSEQLPFTAVRTKGPWRLKRWNYDNWIDQVLETAAIGATLDGGEWIDVVRDRPDWCGDQDWYRSWFLGDELSPGRHTFEIEVTHGNRLECTGTNFRLIK